jgi:[acyl-carrier-protein] S-malonyltransferase
MGRDYYEGSTVARETLDEAAALFGSEFLQTLFEGPEEKLRDTRNAQVALVAIGVAIARHLAANGIAIAGAAGHSVGEIAALVAVESLDYADALRLTRERARLMAEEAPPGAMAAVLGLDPETIAACLPPHVEIANYNGPAQTIVSGAIEGIEAAVEILKAAGAKRVLPLPVSGAFHSSFMAKAADGLKAFLNEVNVKTPKARFVSSVSAAEESDPARIRTLLGNQLCAPVRWTETMQTVGAVEALEAGPGNVLQGLAKRIDGAPTVRAAGTLAEADAARAP